MRKTHSRTGKRKASRSRSPHSNTALLTLLNHRANSEQNPSDSTRHKAQDLLSFQLQLLLEQDLNDSVKQAFQRNFKKLGHYIDKISNEKTTLAKKNDKLEASLKIAQSKLDSVECYKENLARISEQAKTMKEKVQILELRKDCKDELEEKDIKIAQLVKEKDSLSSQIRELQFSLDEQNQVIQHLKKLIAPSAPSSPGSLRPTSDDKEEYLREKILQKQIASLDIEIDMLQKSLQKALDI